MDSLTVDEPTAATRNPLPVRTSITPFAASARTASRITVRETPNCSPSSRSEGRRSPGSSFRAMIVSSRRSATLSESRASRWTGENILSVRVSSSPTFPAILCHAVRQVNRALLADLEGLGEPADPVHVGLEDVDGPQADQLLELPFRVGVLAAAPALPRAAALQLDVAGDVVRQQRLLDPRELQVAQAVRRLERVV